MAGVKRRLGAERLVFASPFSLLDSDLTTCCWGKAHPSQSHPGPGARDARAGNTGATVGGSPHEPGPLLVAPNLFGKSVCARLRSSQLLLQLMQAQAAQLADQATRPATRVAQVLAALIGRTRGGDTCFDSGADRFPGAARQRKLRDTWAAWQVESAGDAPVWRHDLGRPFHRPSADAGCSALFVREQGWVTARCLRVRSTSSPTWGSRL